MASIQNLNLSIPTGGTLPPGITQVMISYTITFAPAEFWTVFFNERVTMRGSDPVMDDTMGTPVVNNLLLAGPGALLRNFTINIPTQDLNEDYDLKLLGLVLRNKDEVYARVSLVPVGGGAGTPARLDSNVVKGQFGP